jgi:hypothetical protein
MSIYTLYDAETGEIRGMIQGSIDDAELNGPYVEGEFSDKEYVIQEGVAVKRLDSVILEANNAEAIIALRNGRNERLKDCDWTQVSDAPVNKADWAAYRQQLRDLPDNTSDPKDVTWPTEPT